MDSFNAYIILQDNDGTPTFIVRPATSGDNASRLNELAELAADHINNLVNE